MSLLLMDGFDADDQTLKWTLIAGSFGQDSYVTSTVTPYGIGRCIQLGGGSTGLNAQSYKQITRQFAATSRPYIGFNFKANLAGTTNGRVFALKGDSGATTHAIVTLNPSGQLILNNGAGTALYTSPVGTILANQWNYVEFTMTVADSGGLYELVLNGTVLTTYTGDTKNAGTATTIDTISLFGGSSSQSSVAPTYWWDDLHVFSNTGTVNNGYTGVLVVQSLFPNGAGSSTQFSPTGGANYTNVQEVPDNTATYNTDYVSGHRDTFALDDLAYNVATVRAVQQCFHGSQIDAGTGNLKQAQKSGSTISYGATKTLTASNAFYSDSWETNPATSAAYTPTEISALEAG